MSLYISLFKLPVCNSVSPHSTLTQAPPLSITHSITHSAKCIVMGMFTVTRASLAFPHHGTVRLSAIVFKWLCYHETVGGVNVGQSYRECFYFTVLPCSRVNCYSSHANSHDIRCIQPYKVQFALKSSVSKRWVLNCKNICIQPIQKCFFYMPIINGFWLLLLQLRRCLHLWKLNVF